MLNDRKRKIDERRAARQRGEPVIAPISRSFAEVADEYLDDRAFERLAPGTQKKYREALNRRVLPHFGERPIGEITTDEIAAWLDGLRMAPRARKRDGRTHGLSESTVNGALSPVRCVFNFAAVRSRQYIATSPVDALEDGERPDSQINARPVQVLDPFELARFLTLRQTGSASCSN